MERSPNPFTSRSPSALRIWFTHDDQRIITLEGFDKNAVLVWNAKTGACEHKITYSAGNVNTIALSSDGRYLAIAGTEQRARVWELASGDPVTPWLEHRGGGRNNIGPSGLTAAAFGPNGLQLATGSVDATLRVWDIDSGQPLTPFISHKEAIQDLAFDATGNRVLALGSEGLFSALQHRPR